MISEIIETCRSSLGRTLRRKPNNLPVGAMHLLQEARRDGSIGIGVGKGIVVRISPIVAQDMIPVVATPTSDEEDRVEVLAMATEHHTGQLVRSGGKSGFGDTILNY